MLGLVTLFVSTLVVSEKQGWVWIPLILLVVAVLHGLAATFTSHWAFTALQFGTMTVLFAVMVSGMFTYMRSARGITDAHLYTAASTYLLLALTWFSLYCAIDTVFPGSFQYAGLGVVDRHSELLYFSLVTLTTVGYGDVVPASGGVRMLAVLEAVAGVLYVAITVALLVSGYKRKPEERT
jgi:voltage-gated potassium channel Kch